ncbi:MAG: sigma-70 family RNA polymerase sigma factor [Acidimicrobiia bacterium]|nr:sigma-70 family RNA polymerase sigma factor [Acidimicrobiia bacterium]
MATADPAPTGVPAAGRAKDAASLDFDDFFRREYRAVVALAAGLSAGGIPMGEDLAQEAFAAAHRRWHDVSRYERPEAWVRRVVANLATSALRRRGRELRAIARLRGRRAPATAPVEPTDEAFWTAVRDLPRRQAQCVALHYLEDRPTAEIATILGLAEVTVRVHLHAGRASLARRLGEDAPAEGPEGDPVGDGRAAEAHRNGR